MQSEVNLVLFARYPLAGQCKTRLVPAIGPEGASAIHRHLTERTVDILSAVQGRLTIAYTGADEDAFSDWLGSEHDYARQTDGDLSDRLLPFADLAPVIFFGSDTPDISIAHVEAAILGLETHRVVIGPALDGGYYLIGMREALPQLLTDMPWSTDRVLPETLGRLDQLDIEPLMLEPLADCDRPEDLKRWPDLLGRSASRARA